MAVNRTVPLVATFGGSQTLPDGGSGSTNGKGFTITGLFRLGDGTFWACNHGKAQNSDPSFAPSLIHLSADRATILDQILLAPLYAGIQSVQGIVYDGTNLWFADLSNKKVRHISTSGTPLSGDIALSYGPNGLAYDSSAGAIWIYADDADASFPNLLEKRLLSDGSLLASTTLVLNDHDHLQYDNATGALYVSYGTNGVSGFINAYFATALPLRFFGAMALGSTANAIEGIVVESNLVYVANDAYFHLGGANVNAIQTYTRGN